MKRRWTLACLLVIAAGALPAEPILLFGGSFGYASQDTAAMQPWSATSVGLFAQSYVDLTATVGLYSAATIGFIVASQDNGIALDPGQYQTFSLNVLLGVGYRIAWGRLTGHCGGRRVLRLEFTQRDQQQYTVVVLCRRGRRRHRALLFVFAFLQLGNRGECQRRLLFCHSRQHCPHNGSQRLQRLRRRWRDVFLPSHREL